MRKSDFTEPQIMSVLCQAKSGMAVPELCREHGISTASFYKWRSKYGYRRIASFVAGCRVAGERQARRAFVAA